jgi:hypothetical protein
MWRRSMLGSFRPHKRTAQISVIARGSVLHDRRGTAREQQAPKYGRFSAITCFLPESAGVGPIGWHSFRHSYSTLLRSLQVDLKVQQNFCGIRTFAHQ